MSHRHHEKFGAFIGPNIISTCFCRYWTKLYSCVLPVLTIFYQWKSKDGLSFVVFHIIHINIIILSMWARYKAFYYTPTYSQCDIIYILSHRNSYQDIQSWLQLTSTYSEIHFTDHCFIITRLPWIYHLAPSSIPKLNTVTGAVMPCAKVCSDLMTSDSIMIKDYNWKFDWQIISEMSS